MIEIENKILEGYSYIDLFAGIGGFHLALKSFGAKCIFASEIDKFASQTYQENHKFIPNGDITKIKEQEIPKHDILCAGFPCQAFSISGKQKGFDDVRGTLFFEIERILKFHKPKIIFLENVKNLEKHNQGKTFQFIIKKLKDLDYNVFTKVMNSSDFGLAQNRERLYFIAFHKSINSSVFNFPKPINKKVYLENILEENPLNIKIIERNDIEIYKNPSEHNLENINKILQIGKVNKGRQGERIYSTKGFGITLSANGGGIGSKTGLYLIKNKIRKLSPKECARLQGFPDDFIINKNINQAYKQFGNSVSINVLQHILIQVGEIIKNQ